MSYISNPSGGGGGGGTVTSITAGTGLTATPNPIVGVGTIELTVPVTVPLGGTGVTTMTTAYAPICAGTTATGALQVASTGLATAGFVLTSNGNAALPSFQAAAGGGITTIDGDVGSATGATVDFNAQPQAGGTIFFNASGSTVKLDVSDSVLSNTFLGLNAGNTTTSSNQSTAFGKDCLTALTSGNYNTAIGQNCLPACTDGIGNVGLGTNCLFTNVSGDYNFALGFLSLFQLNGGDSNICIGHQSGFNYTTTESFNIIIGESVAGTVGESGVTRIGTPGSQTAAYISGIYGSTVNIGTGLPVVIDSNNLMGTILSTRRVKKNIVDMADYSNVLMKLRPITFNYISDESQTTCPGLIAEEVINAMPDLVVKDEAGQPYAVRYHDLPVLLLNEVQKLRKEVNELKRRL